MNAPQTESRGDPPTSARVGRTPPSLDRAAAWSWRLLVVALVLAGGLWLIARLWLVLVPVAVAILLARVLVGVTDNLEARGLRRSLAAALTLVTFLAALGAAITLIGVAVADEFSDLGPTVGQAIDDIEDWLVEDGPFDLDRQSVRNLRADLGAAVDQALRGSGDDIVAGAVLAAELLLGVFVGVVMAFYALKDGDRLLAWIGRRLPADKRPDAARVGRRAWTTLGGFLRGAALLGLVEGIAVGLAVLVTGGSLVIPVAVFTFLAAFVPFVGAIVAGVVAVLVTLTTAGPAAAIVVAIVVVVVQQFDNELLAPVVYGRALRLHPVVVLLAVVIGGAALGVAGTVLAVPVAAILINVIDELHPAAELTTADEE